MATLARLVSGCAIASVSLAALWSGSGRASLADGQGGDLLPTARDLSDQGLRQYQQGELDAAIESFMGAFALSNNSGLLFNVAQAYRLKGDCARAKDYYRRYLDAVPDTALRSSVERRLAEMETCSKATTATIAAPAAAGSPARRVPAAPSPAPPPASPPPTGLAGTLPPNRPSQAEATASPANRAAVWALRGSAAALLASAAVFGVLSWEARRDFDSTPYQRPAWDADDRFRLDTTLAWSFAASGVACALASYLFGSRR